MAIHFFSEDIDLPDIDKKQIKEWVKKVILSHSMLLGNVNYIFTSDDYILSVNKTYLEHDYYTDVITFDYSEHPKISGDIFISLETVKTNAEKYKQTYISELNRVIIHGILHLVGFKDKSDSEAKEMRRQENKALELII